MSVCRRNPKRTRKRNVKNKLKLIELAFSSTSPLMFRGTPVIINMMMVHHMYGVTACMSKSDVLYLYSLINLFMRI